ncbi:MAG: hypothetical protein UT13_C0001G0665 [Candidatus Pacebacteria bacterium GW2011_GWF2_38_9]|nr:MAG: hypothetical protein US01_C0001G0694 [candidate division TM6 bacterium GW2011_GWF2_28_16]KKQ08652.1 MAG: hypothetical protein US20_C0013G0002 [Candidatus Pacebacteria bacterium GW2011_GWF1_36_5]KKQ89018.1 MAG: hypothetical protein UT13_C0001G0665 [Candidatus Pacebacteria bacterium GW2011_GWF2_38_9]HAZ73194.1 hypothetical protein [Candidatus Paceibacterota bacterium]
MPEKLDQILNRAIIQANRLIITDGKYEHIDGSEMLVLYNVVFDTMLQSIPKFLPDCESTKNITGDYSEISDADMEKFIKLANSVAISVLSEHCAKKIDGFKF